MRLAHRLLPAPGPARLLALSDLVATLGSSAPRFFLPVWLTRHVGLGAGSVGVALSISGIAAMLTAVPGGRLADRAGARRVLVWAGLAVAACTLLLGAARSFTTVAVALALSVVAFGIRQNAQNALIGVVLAQEERVRLSAYLRSVRNLGFTFSALAAGLVIAIDSRAVYLGAFVVAALAEALVALLRRGLPDVPPHRPEAATRLGAVRDLPYLAVGLLCGFARLNGPILEAAMPLWVIRHTAAPRALVGVLVALNTVTVVLLQVRISAGSESTAGALRVQRRGLVATAAACGAFALAAVPDAAVAASGVLVAAILVLTASEMLTSAGEWSLRFGLAPAERQGEYGGVFGLAAQVEDAAGPAATIALTDGFGALGWAALALLSFGVTAVAGPVVRRAERRRIPAG